jgi:hypothetical protein
LNVAFRSAEENVAFRSAKGVYASKAGGFASEAALPFAERKATIDAVTPGPIFR